jgi:protein required for attachment to host cells
MRPSHTWVCVADGSRAQVFRCDGPGRDLEPVLDIGPITKRIAVQLDRAAADNLFEHLVLVGPAAILGELRNHLEPRTRGKVVGEMTAMHNLATPREVGCYVCELLPH